MQNRLVFIRNVIYQLKREYGAFLTIGVILPGEVNLQTGEKNTKYIEHKIPRAIKLPNSITFDFLRAVGIIPQQKGLSLPVGAFSLLIDRRDLGHSFPKPEPGKSFAILGLRPYERRLDILKADDYEYAQILWVKELIGSEIPSNELASVLTLDQTVTQS